MMTTALEVDLDALLKPIAGSDSAGDAHAYSYRVRAELEELRKEERAEDFDDLTRPAQLKRADWPGVVALSEKTLIEESKDLRVACHLAEGLVRRDGFASLPAAFELLTRLVDECWDRLHPAIDDGDLDSRAAPLANMLDDPVRGLRFPTTVRDLPLFGPPDDAHSLLDWQRANQPGGDEAHVELQQALRKTPPDRARETIAEIDRAAAALSQLTSALENHMHEAAPALLSLRAAIDECRGFAQEKLAGVASATLPPFETTGATPPAAAAATPVAAGETEPSEPSRSPPASTLADGVGTAVMSRNEIYAQLTRLAEALQQLEPHSPVPFLVKRAVNLGRLPFPQLMEKLIRDRNTLDEVNREMGADEDAGASS